MTPSEFPVPTRTALDDLLVAAAKLRLGLLRSNEMPRLAMAALDEGHSGISLGEMAIERLPNLREHEGLFLEVLRECGIQMPTAEQAVEILLRHYIEMIARGAIGAYDGLDLVVHELHHPYISETPAIQYVGDQKGLQHLIGAYYSYDELRFRPDEVSFEGLYGDAALSALDRSVQRLAQEWLRNQAAAGSGAQLG